MIGLVSSQGRSSGLFAGGIRLYPRNSISKYSTLLDHSESPQDAPAGPPGGAADEARLDEVADHHRPTSRDINEPIAI